MTEKPNLEMYRIIGRQYRGTQACAAIIGLMGRVEDQHNALLLARDCLSRSADLVEAAGSRALADRMRQEADEVRRLLAKAAA